MSATCELRFHHCGLANGQTGFCRAWVCQDGAIIPLNYGRLASLALDPIEKKPLRRFRPRSLILSVGSFGYNLRCPFCQNHEISMTGDGTIQTVDVSPEQLADTAQELVPQGNIGVAYTYNEPLVGYEYVRDCAALIHDIGMDNVLVSNGTIEERPWRALLPYLDAANIDLKGFTPEWYRRLGGDLDTVKRSIALASGQCHLEVTTLLVPGENDGVEEIRALAQWLASVSPDIPLHLSQFFPRYQMRDCPPTPVERIYQLADLRLHWELLMAAKCVQHLLIRKRHADADLPAVLVLLHDQCLSCLRIFSPAYFNMRESMKYITFIHLEISRFFAVIFWSLGRY